jgi:hypothetical protein
MDIACDLRAARDGDAEAVSEVIISALRETNAKDYPPEVIARIEKNFSPAAVLDLMGKRKVLRRQCGNAGCRDCQPGWWRDSHHVRGAGRPAARGRPAADVGNGARGARGRPDDARGPAVRHRRALYARLGFKAVHDQYYGEERTIIMERDLTPVP